MKIIGIAAVGKSGQIGLDNKLPWRNSEEMRHFRTTTKDSVLIIGRKTWDSIPKKYWQFNGRKVIVISKKTKGGNDNVFYVDCPAQAHLLASFVRKPGQGVFVCGGESVYKFFLPHMSNLIISEMDYDGDSDAKFPEYTALFENTKMELVRSNDGDFKIKTYERKYDGF